MNLPGSCIGKTKQVFWKYSNQNVEKNFKNHLHTHLVGFPTRIIRTRIIRVFFTIRTQNISDQILDLFEYPNIAILTKSKAKNGRFLSLQKYFFTKLIEIQLKCVFLFKQSMNFIFNLNCFTILQFLSETHFFREINYSLRKVL